MKTRTMPRAIRYLLILCCTWATSFPAYANNNDLPRTPDNHPDLNGIWQAITPAYWNIEPHPASAAALDAAGALGATRGGVGIVVGGEIPYQDWARKKQQQNFTTRQTQDPALFCKMPGVPRANYMPYPLQIVQSGEHLFIAYEFAQGSRTIYLNKADFEAPVDTWMGHSLGRWEDDTLYVDVSAQVPDTWLDRAGNFHSAKLQVEEQYRLLSPYHIEYTATLTDPDVYTKPWQLRTILYKNITPNAQLLDFRCIEFVEELMYGHLSKGASAGQAAETQNESTNNE